LLKFYAEVLTFYANKISMYNNKNTMITNICRNQQLLIAKQILIYIFFI